MARSASRDDRLVAFDDPPGGRPKTSTGTERGSASALRPVAPDRGTRRRRLRAGPVLGSEKGFSIFRGPVSQHVPRLASSLPQKSRRIRASHPRPGRNKNRSDSGAVGPTALRGSCVGLCRGKIFRGEMPEQLTLKKLPSPRIPIRRVVKALAWNCPG